MEDEQKKSKWKMTKNLNKRLPKNLKWKTIKKIKMEDDQIKKNGRR